MYEAFRLQNMYDSKRFVPKYEVSKQKKKGTIKVLAKESHRSDVLLARLGSLWLFLVFNAQICAPEYESAVNREIKKCK